MRGARLRRDAKISELTDLYRDGAPREAALYRPANVALPHLW